MYQVPGYQSESIRDSSGGKKEMKNDMKRRKRWWLISYISKENFQE